MAKRRRRSLDKNRMRKRREERAQGGRTAIKLPEGVDFYEVKKGYHKINILPYEVTQKGHPEAEPGELWFCRPYYIHRNVGIEEKSRICLKSFGEACPICKAAADMKLNPDTDEDDIRALKPQRKVLYNVRKDGDDEIKVFDFSHFNFQKVIDAELDAIEDDEERDEYELYADLEEGKTLKVRFREETFSGHSYFKADRVDFLDRDPIDEDVLDEVVDLDKCLIKLDYDKLEQEFLGVDAQDIDEDEDEEEEKPTRSKKRKKQEEEDEDLPFDPDEVEIPDGMKRCPACEGSGVSSKGRKCHPCKGKGYLPDDSPEEEEEEEEEVKKPKRGKKKGKSKDKCPHGHKFGKDCDEHEECEDCELWDDCLDAGA